MENSPEPKKKFQIKKENLRFTFAREQLQSNLEQNPLSQNPNENPASQPDPNPPQNHQNPSVPLSQESSDQIMLHLLDLESKWIQKETQIKNYVENLQKTLDQKDLKIEKLQIENYKLASQLTQMTKQKNDIFQKLNQIHTTMISLQNKKLQNDSDKKTSEKHDQTQQHEMIAEILKLAKEKESKNISSLPPQCKSSQRNSERENSENDTKSMEKRILSSMIKLFEENFNFASSNMGSEESSEANGENRFTKKGRQIRCTLATNDTLSTNPRDPRGSFINKEVSSPISSQKDNSSVEAKKKLNYYKSARTITFSKDEEADEQVMSDKEKIYSHNVIQFDQKIYSENETSEHKESERSDSKKETEHLLNLKKRSDSKSLKVESKALNQSYESGQVSKDKKKSKERKKSSNLDYSLSSSLVSASETNEMASSKMEEQECDDLKPLSHESAERNAASIALSKFSGSDFNMKKSKIFETDDSRPIYDKRQNSHSRGLSQLFEESAQSRSPFDEERIKPINSNEIQGSSTKPDETKKLSNPEASPSLKKNELFINTAFTFQNTPQNHVPSVQNTAEKPSVNTLKKSMTLQRQNSVAFEQTHMKRSLFEPNEFDAFETEAKNNQNSQFDSHLNIPSDKANMFSGKVGPETKCSTFLEKSYGNSFYMNKSSCSDDPFKRLKMQEENSDNEQGKKSYKLNFENQMLKSYNKVLDKQTKKMSQTQKLMQKFNNQNVSILNKIHKKSIF